MPRFGNMRGLFYIIIKNMANSDYKTEWTLKEISEWCAEGSTVSIPAVQRGLVWKPQQVELLWDSILRQFPIGAFTLSSSNENGVYSFNLLDGQQRWNAISLGYGSVPVKPSEVRAVLWFDLKPEECWKSAKTTRKYFVRATTKAHPWGYNANDDCSRFNAEERRSALEQLGMKDKNIYKDGISLSETYPVKSGLPLPLCWLLEAGARSKGNRDVFTKFIRDKITENTINPLFRLKDVRTIDDDLIAKYQAVFEAAAEYLVPTIYLEQNIIDKEGQSSKTNESLADIEILFARIGTGGTQITQNELIYSAIKAYWPVEIKEENDRLADLYMPPFTLISLAFRLALSPDENGNLSGSLSVNKVRQIAAAKSDSYKAICEIYKKNEEDKSDLEEILEIVDSWLTKDYSEKIVLPTVLRTGIARTSPDVYLLLMYFAKVFKENGEKPSFSDVLFFRAIAFYFHWMVDKGARAWAVSSLYSILQKTPYEEWKVQVKCFLMELYAKQKAIPLISPATFRGLFEKIGSDSEWRPWNDDHSKAPWWPLWNMLAFNREMLMYAQRKYLCEEFPNYDPAKLDLWEEYNRPWDYDHIIPQDWIYQYRLRKKEYSDYCFEWKDNNGNMAAIPFEENRSKGNRSDWDIYRSKKKELLADEEIDKYEVLFNSKLTEDKDQSHLFAQKTFNRLCKIYDEIYSLLSPVDVNNGEGMTLLDNADNDLRMRQSRLSYIAEKLKSSVFFVCNEKEYRQERFDDWARPWMSVGIITKNNYYAAITMEITQECKISDRIEIGLRRKPGSYDKNGKISTEFIEGCNSHFNDIKFESVDSSWWYIFAYIPARTSDEEIVDYLKTLAGLTETELK